ncbi:MAG: 2Fe-2S iron-sulfur cluster binding domain-containing protein [Desulfobacteraceae bacterium]|nr:2Fe-2S iron-sulfur cluster binding domain-containing protein [Desulfobacteraceae bacterium]
MGFLKSSIVNIQSSIFMVSGDRRLKVPITIDGQMVQIDQRVPIIDAAKKAGIVIPTLCYHEALKPYGSCRLCMVEIIMNKQRRLVTACNFPVEGGMEVFTDTAKLRHIRKMIIELLLARCPDVPSLHTMAKQMGIKSSRFKKQGAAECILCGLCVRFCEEVVGVSAIGLANRGIDREVATPFKVASDVCIGCGSCTYICPTGCIEMLPDEKTPQMRRMNIGKHSLNPCINDFNCETCPVEKEFFEDMRLVVAEFRSN